MLWDAWTKGLGLTCQKHCDRETRDKLACPVYAGVIYVGNALSTPLLCLTHALVRDTHAEVRDYSRAGA